MGIHFEVAYGTAFKNAAGQRRGGERATRQEVLVTESLRIRFQCAVNVFHGYRIIDSPVDRAPRELRVQLPGVSSRVAGDDVHPKLAAVQAVPAAAIAEAGPPCRADIGIPLAAVQEVAVRTQFGEEVLGPVFPVEIVVVIGKVDGQCITGRNAQGQAGHRALVPAQPVVAALLEINIGVGVRILPGAVELRVVVSRKYRNQAGDNRSGHCAGVVVTRMIAGDDLPLQVPFIAGPPGNVIDRAHEGVASVAGALRALDHLDALHVGEAQVGHIAARQIYAVEENRHVLLAGLQYRHLGGAAYDRRGTPGAAEVLEIESGREQRDVAHVLDAALLQLLRGERGDGQRNVLDRLFALAGGDDDLLKLGFLADGNVDLGRSEQDCRGYGQANRKCFAAVGHGMSSRSHGIKKLAGAQGFRRCALRAGPRETQGPSWICAR